MELQNISGVGAGKAQRYGQAFVEVIRRYVKKRRSPGLRIWSSNRW
jgi:predicted CopG family antitoxin